MNPFDPSDEDLCAWARSGEPEPVQDFDLMVSTPERAPVLIALAADPSLPWRRYILHCLYLLVGDAVRTDNGNQAREVLELASASAAADEALARWADRSRKLLANPDTFDYGLWCDGGYAYREEP
jgi:hypothetical protein